MLLFLKEQVLLQDLQKQPPLGLWLAVFQYVPLALVMTIFILTLIVGH